VPAPVLDAHALMVFLEREDGFEKVKQCFAEALALGDMLPMTVVNLGEVLYVVRREEGGKKADEVEHAVQMLPIDVVDIDMALTRVAARYKAAGGISYADSFAAALAHQRGRAVLTGDPEFAAVADDIPIEWLWNP